MNREDITRMARESCDPDKVDAWHNGFWTLTQEELERFFALAAAAERARMIEDGWRQCAKGQRTTQFCGQLEQALIAEREACAKVCEGRLQHGLNFEGCAAAIRARGQQ